MASVLCVKRIAYMKYITTFVVSKENDRKERNERKKENENDNDSKSLHS